jgi:hypothetical protein
MSELAEWEEPWQHWNHVGEMGNYQQKPDSWKIPQEWAGEVQAIEGFQVS